MNRILIFILAGLFSLTAYAADITWSVTTSAGTVTQSSPILSDANMDRFIAWACYAYVLTDDAGTPDDPSDDTVIPCTTPAQQAQHVRAWMDGQWQGTKANVIRWEQSEAAQSAQDGVTDLE